MIEVIDMNGYWYSYVYRTARHNVDYCLATKDPKQYCNGIYIYSSKDPGTGVEYVIVDTNDPEIKAELLLQEAKMEL